MSEHSIQQQNIEITKRIDNLENMFGRILKTVEQISKDVEVIK